MPITDLLLESVRDPDATAKISHVQTSGFTDCYSKEIINKEKVAEWCYISNGTELYSAYELFSNV